LGRPPLSYEQYDLLEYKRVCSELVERVLADLQLFAAGQCEIQFLVGIGQSPSCATTGKLGHFMELLLPRVVELFPKVKVVEIPADYREGSLHPFIEELEQ
jgi:predicted secreted protein